MPKRRKLDKTNQTSTLPNPHSTLCTTHSTTPQVGYTTHMIRTMLLAMFFMVLPAAAQAQALPIPGISQTPVITLSPAYPAPFDTVTAQVTVPNADISSSDIAWLLDNKPITEGVGTASTTFAVGDVGTAQTLSVIVRTPEGATVAAQALLNPVRISLQWEAQTYTPPFYKGRALYTAGAYVTVEAQVLYKDPSGTLIPSTELVYNWRRNGSALQSDSGRGKSVVRTVGPKFYGEDIVSVEVRTKQGIVVGTAATRIETKDPVLDAYVWSPVTGIAYGTAVSNTDGSVGNATTIVAEPYFMSAPSAKSPLLIYTWLVNGRAVTVQPDTPQFLSLSSEDAVSATVSLSVTHQTALLQEAKQKWQLRFKDGGFGIFGF